MFSDKEQNYLNHKKQFSKSYGYVIEHRIKKKLQQFYILELPLITQNQNLTEFYKKLTEFHNESLEIKKLRTGSGPATFTLPR